MQRSLSHIKDLGDFIEKIKRISNIPDDSLVTADIVRLYSIIPHELCLRVLVKALEKGESKQVSTCYLVKMAKFVLENNYFEFNGETKEQTSATALGTKFAPPYASIFMDQVESEFVKKKIHQLLV